jgi:hypothetical protein
MTERRADRNHENRSDPPRLAAGPRKAYRSPALTVYGSVKELTAGVGSANGDGGQVMMN